MERGYHVYGWIRHRRFGDVYASLVDEFESCLSDDIGFFHLRDIDNLQYNDRHDAAKQYGLFCRQGHCERGRLGVFIDLVMACAQRFPFVTRQFEVPVI